jgi:hypothetical protein
MARFLKNLAGLIGGIFFAVTAAYAIKGGPQYPAGTDVVGTYAGVLTPKASPCPDASVSPTPVCSPTIADCAANSLGVFSVSAPQNGLASGTFVMFAQGRVFTGTIQGVADPEKATLKGVLSARYDFTVTFPPTPCPSVSPEVSCTPSSFSEQITALANGSLKTRITTSTAGAASAATRLKGTATLDISNGTVSAVTFEQITDCEIFLKVTGFKQSSSASTSGVLPTGSP